MLKKRTLFLKNPILVIGFVWLVLTAFNINKAFHGDDAFHLEAAQHIMKHPAHPMSGFIRWDKPEPSLIKEGNQPPLLFYIIAGVSWIFGFNEIALHVVLSIFTFLALLWFYKFCKLMEASHPLVLVALLGLSPVFIVNQNIMTDTPILALIIGSGYYLFLAEKTNRSKYYWISIILLSIGFFIKYSILPVLVAVAFIFIIKKQYKNLQIFIVPIGLLILWSFWNYVEFGGFHFFSRKATPLISRSHNLWAFITCLGSVSPFGIILLNYILKGTLNKVIVYSTTVLFICLIAFCYLSTGNYEPVFNYFLEALFLLNGLIIILSVIKIFYTEVKIKKLGSLLASNKGMIFIILSALCLFIILLAPFIGSRHLLLTIPFILLLIEPAIEISKNWILTFALLTTFILGALIGYSDWQYAHFYKRSAKTIMQSPSINTTVWATGTGGWQWYTKYYGMKEYAFESSNVQIGDLIVVASKTPNYRINSTLNVSLLLKLWGDKITPFTYLSASHDFSMYFTDFGKPSWKLSKTPIDTIYILQCIGYKKQ